LDSAANPDRRPSLTIEACGAMLVKPGDLDASYLYQKIARPMPCALPDCAITLVAQWIGAGAPSQ
jgi:hypothetical protein